MSRIDIETNWQMPVRIFWTLIGAAVVAIASVIFVTLWMSASINALAADSARTMINSQIETALETTAINVSDYVYWDGAYDWIVARADEDVFDNIGTGATDGDLFDLIYILGADGIPLYAYQSDGDDTDLTLFDPEAAAPIVSLLDGIPLGQEEVLSGFTTIDGVVHVLAIGRVQPADITGLTAADTPLLIAGTVFAEERLTRIADLLSVSGITISTQVRPKPESIETQTLADFQGNPIAQVGWTVPAPGFALFYGSVPIIILLSLLKLTAGIMIGRHSARQAQEILAARADARTDRLTKLRNRDGLDAILATDAFQDAREAGHVALMYMDLNGFKGLNDTLGHQVGDEALKVIANRLTSTVRSGDHLIRIGGDEFICLVIDKSPLQAAEVTAARILRCTSPKFFVGQHRIEMRLAIGIAVAHPALRWSEVMAHADKAMYHAKANKLQTAHVYGPDTKSDTIKQIAAA